MPAPAPVLRSPAAAETVHVRRATASDLDGLVALEQATFALDRMSARQWRRHLESLTAEVFVATRARRAVGAAVVFRRRGSDIARLYSIAVAAGERGGGIGRKLLDAVERSARRHGCRRLRLEVRCDNLAAQHLYERAGYHAFGTYAAYYEDGADAQRYEKRLAAT